MSASELLDRVIELAKTIGYDEAAIGEGYVVSPEVQAVKQRELEECKSRLLALVRGCE